MAKYSNVSATGLIKTGAGTLYGVVVNSHTSGTAAFADGIIAAAAGVKATGVLTSSGVFENNDTVIIGDETYTFKTTLTGAADEVLIGASAAASLDNLKSAINGTAGEGTTYGTGTLANVQVTATTNTDTAQTVEAIRAGAYANAIATTETCANVAWGAATLENGAGVSNAIMTTFSYPSGSGVYMFGAEGMAFNDGLHFTEGGTSDITIIYE